MLRNLDNTVTRHLVKTHFVDTIFCRLTSLYFIFCRQKCLSGKCISINRREADETVKDCHQPGKPNWRGRLSTLDLLVRTSLDQMLLTLKILFTFVRKQATLIRRSTVGSLPLQLEFPDWSQRWGWWQGFTGET